MASLSMLDLFSGTGAASRAAEVRGWRVYRIDKDACANANLKVDLLGWEPTGYWDLIWASPPCALLSGARTKGRDLVEGVKLVHLAKSIIDKLKPRWWVIENVHGATLAISALLGPPVERYGSFYLWGCFPPFEASIPRDKTKMSGRRRSERRARIPWAISYGLVTACERLAVELGILGLRPPGDISGRARGELGAQTSAGENPEGAPLKNGAQNDP